MSEQNQQAQQTPEQEQMQALAESNNDLVSYVQDYQGQIAEKTFMLVQANANVRKLQSKLADAEQTIRDRDARIAELNSEQSESKPAKATAKAS